MNFIVFSEISEVEKAIQGALEMTTHSYRTIQLDSVSELKNTEGYDGLIADKKSWQRNASLLKYFGVLESINQKPLLIVSTDSRNNRLKFRNSSGPKPVTCSYPVDQDEFNGALDKLAATAVPSEA